MRGVVGGDRPASSCGLCVGKLRAASGGLVWTSQDRPQQASPGKKICKLVSYPIGMTWPFFVRAGKAAEGESDCEIKNRRVSMGKTYSSSLLALLSAWSHVLRFGRGLEVARKP